MSNNSVHIRPATQWSIEQTGFIIDLSDSYEMLSRQVFKLCDKESVGTNDYLDLQNQMDYNKSLMDDLMIIFIEVYSAVYMNNRYSPEEDIQNEVENVLEHHKLIDVYVKELVIVNMIDFITSTMVDSMSFNLLSQFNAALGFEGVPDSFTLSSRKSNISGRWEARMIMSYS